MINFNENIVINETEKEFILNNLPVQWETVIKEVFPSTDMEILIKVNAKTIEETNKWILDFQEKTNTTFSVHNTRKCAGERLTYKKLYRCHHNTRRKETYDPVHRKNVKNTKCPAYIMVYIRVTGKRYRGKNQNDKPDPEKPCEIKLKLQHNHSINEGMAPKFRRVLPEIRNELIELYKQGNTPATALQRIKSDIRVNYTNYEEILKDRSKCPDYRFCHYIYERFIAKSEIHLNEDFLINKLENYNHIMSDECAKIATNETGYVICFCPPFVKRVHKYAAASAAVAFVYTINISDKKGSKMFVLLTSSEIGALPLGIVISTSKSTSMIFTGFSLLKELLGEVAFGGNVLGPEYFIIDEFLAQQNIFNVLWPQANILLGLSFILKNIWRWLNTNLFKHNSMNLEDKLKIFIDFNQVVYAETEDEFRTKYENAKTNAAQYEHYLKLLNNYYDKRKQWAFCYRTTEKHSEIAFRILKSKYLLRLKSYNIFQAVDFIINNFFLYFEHRLLDAANTGSIDSILDIQEDLPPIDTLEKIKILSDSTHLVPGEKTKGLMYLVNTDTLTCTCFNGFPGTVCKHVQWICLLMHSEVFNKKLINIPDVKNNYYLIAKESTTIEVQYGDETIESNNEINFFEIQKSNNESTNNINLFDIKNDLFFEDALIVEVEENEDQKVNLIKEGKEIWKKITKIYEDILYNSPEETTAAAKILASNFENLKSTSDFYSACHSFGSSNAQLNQNTVEQLTNKEVAAATKLLLLSSSTSNISDQSEKSDENQTLPSTTDLGTKRIILLSGNITSIDGPNEKKIKLIPLENKIIQ